MIKVTGAQDKCHKNKILWYLPACPGVLRGEECRILGCERAANARTLTPQNAGTLTTGTPKERKQNNQQTLLVVLFSLYKSN
jgi:hypothetical protein